jgi:hypothetical protein
MLLEACVDTGTPAVHACQTQFVSGESSMQRADTTVGKNIGAYLDKPDKKPRNQDHYYMITYRNIERVTLRYRKENGIKDNQMETTLAAMHKDGWRCCLQMIKQGIPQAFYDQFTASCKGSTIFTSNRFAMMRRPVV